MKRLFELTIFAIICLIAGSQVSHAQDKTLQIFNGDKPRYTPLKWNDISSIGFKADEELMIINLTDGQSLQNKISDGSTYPSGQALPLIEITTDEFIEEITDKKIYKSAFISLEGFGQHENLSDSVLIRGRGNSSWGYPKKPYRLKFPKKISICGLPKAKNYVLLANYTDKSLMQFALATKLGEMLEMPFVNHVVPVDVVFNGMYKGSYLLTNKVGINSGSVDIDEENSVMWELDVNYDEDKKFRSPILDLPVMLKDPDMDDAAFESWKNDFEEMEKKAVNFEASDAVDMDAFAKYLLVYQIMLNGEIGWPKSINLFKTDGGKYIFGLIWDFDFAMGSVWNGEPWSIEKVNDTVWLNKLFAYLTMDPEYKTAVKKHWATLRTKLPEIIDYLDAYAAEIRTSAHRNSATWPEFGNFDSSYEKMKNWLILRYEAIDKFPELHTPEEETPSGGDSR